MPEFAALDRAGPALEVPLWTLRLEKKTDILSNAGYSTLASLLTGYRSGLLLRVPGVGRSTLEDVSRKLSILDAAVAKGAGTIDWQHYAVSLGHELVPGAEVQSGRDFIAAFAEVTAAVIRSHLNPVEQMILNERLVRQPGERLTLEQIGQRAVPAITRERVRQLEKRLIGALSDALLLDDYLDLPFHFRTSFAERWKAAAQRFIESSEISFGAFMTGLSEVWDVPYAELLPHLPLITSILTSRATLPPQLREAARLHPRLYGEVSQQLLDRPVGWLALGKSGSEILERGIETVGDLIAAGRADRLPPLGTKAGTDCRRSLNALAEAISECGTVNWHQFGVIVGLRNVPASDRDSTGAFLQHLNGDLEDVVRVTGTSGRAAGIFRLRTCVPRFARPTLEQTAQILGGHASTIKREETELLAALHDQLVAEDFLHSRILYPPRFMAHWGEARRVFERSHSDFDRFCSLLADEWRVPVDLVAPNAEGLWAVLSRYPSGHRARVRRHRSVPLPIPSAFTGGTIVLRGFRRAH